jgi:hypothetical protein
LPDRSVAGKDLLDLGIKGNSGITRFGPLTGNEFGNQVSESVRVDLVQRDINAVLMVFRDHGGHNFRCNAVKSYQKRCFSWSRW